MASRLKKLFDPQAAPTTVAALYTVPARYKTQLSAVTASNAGTDVRALSAYLVPDGDSASDSENVAYYGYEIAPGATVILAGLIGQIIEAGDSLQFEVDAGSDLIMHASGVERVDGS
jgi:hypothetical protein